jgi:hypothetical protein
VFKIALYILNLLVAKGAFYRSEYERIKLAQKGAASIVVNRSVIDLSGFGLPGEVSYDITSIKFMNAMFVIQLIRHMKLGEGVKHEVTQLLSDSLVQRATTVGVSTTEIERIIDLLVENHFSVAGSSILDSADGDNAGTLVPIQQIQAFFAGAGVRPPQGKGGKHNGKGQPRGRPQAAKPSSTAGGLAAGSGGSMGTGPAASGGGSVIANRPKSPATPPAQRSASLVRGITLTSDIYEIAMKLAGNKFQGLGMLGDRFNSYLQQTLSTTDNFFKVGSDGKVVLPLKPDTAIWAQGWKHFFNPRLRRDFFILLDFFKDVCKFSPQLTSSGAKYKERKDKKWESIQTAAAFAKSYQDPPQHAIQAPFPATEEIIADSASAKVKAFCF